MPAKHSRSAAESANQLTAESANQLTAVSTSGLTTGCTYNGLGNRLSQLKNSVTTLTAGLTQVLQDGTNTYLCGERNLPDSRYFLPDAQSLAQPQEHGEAINRANTSNDLNSRLGGLKPRLFSGCLYTY
jgi:hypothetical protein